jgi:preprotein translocase subunit SecY
VLIKIASKHAGKRRSEHIILAVALAVGALLVLVVALVFVRQRRRRIEAHKEQSGKCSFIYSQNMFDQCQTKYTRKYQMHTI